MEKIFLCFGDSFPAGAELQNLDHRFPVLIAKQLGLELKDYSQGATSIDHSVLFFLDFLETTWQADNQYHALFCLTDASRSLHFSPAGDPIEITPHLNSPAAQVFYKWIFDTHYEKFAWKKNILLIECLCEKYGIKGYFVNNWEHPYDPSGLVKRYYPQSICSFLGYQDRECNVGYDHGCNPFQQSLAKNTNIYFQTKGYHPNELGHATIADKLSQWISTDSEWLV